MVQWLFLNSISVSTGAVGAAVSGAIGGPGAALSKGMNPVL